MCKSSERELHAISNAPQTHPYMNEKNHFKGRDWVIPKNYPKMPFWPFWLRRTSPNFNFTGAARLGGATGKQVLAGWTLWGGEGKERVPYPEGKCTLRVRKPMVAIPSTNHCARKPSKWEGWWREGGQTIPLLTDPGVWVCFQLGKKNFFQKLIAHFLSCGGGHFLSFLRPASVTLAARCKVAQINGKPPKNSSAFGGQWPGFGGCCPGGVTPKKQISYP